MLLVFHACIVFRHLLACVPLRAEGSCDTGRALQPCKGVFLWDSPKDNLEAEGGRLPGEIMLNVGDDCYGCAWGSMGWLPSQADGLGAAGVRADNLVGAEQGRPAGVRADNLVKSWARK